MTEEVPLDVDRELLAQAQAGDLSAFEALVEKHRDKVYGVALRMTRSEADAAEITQETFLSAFQHLPEFRGEAAFGSWVHRIAANHALMRLRHQNVVQAADEKALDAELGTAIQQATDRLPNQYREVFVLKDVEGLSYEQISEITGDSIPAIKSRLHRARLELREAIDRFYNEK